MNVQLDPKKEKALADAAREQGKEPDERLSEIVDRYLQERHDGAPASKKGWLKKVEGCFANDLAFDEVVKLGRKFRESVD